MLSLPGWKKWLGAIIEPDFSPALESVLETHRQNLPVLWLLGKTGAGKSSIVQRLTGDTRVQIGEGFAPCTMNALHYDHPKGAPVLRFLDTRGLGEADYDPQEDLAMAQHGSHALLIITRVDDPSQEHVLSALEELKSTGQALAIIQVHTALHTLDEQSRARSIRNNQQQIENSIGKSIRQVQIDFTAPDDGFDDPDVGLSELCTAIIDLVPELSTILTQQHSDSDEESLYLSVRKEILGYASASAAADVLPAVGLIAVPSVQGKMLHALAGRYGLQWNKRLASEFVTTLGISFLYRYLISLGGRQLVKLIPVYGQSAGAAAAASISFASTYALGRAACLYFYRRKINKSIDSSALRETFVQAFEQHRNLRKK